MTLDKTQIREVIKVTAKCQTTLLLDNHWMPIRVIQGGKAFSYLFRDSIITLDINYRQYNAQQWLKEQRELIATSEYPVITTARDIWAVPTLAIIKSPFKRKRVANKRIYLDELLELYDYTCQICLKQYKHNAFDPKEIFNRDHVLPRSKGGPDDDFNIVLACKQCNSNKGSQYPYYNVKGDEIRTKSRIRFCNVINGKVGIRDEWRPFLFKAEVA